MAKYYRTGKLSLRFHLLFYFSSLNEAVSLRKYPFHFCSRFFIYLETSEDADHSLGRFGRDFRGNARHLSLPLLAITSPASMYVPDVSHYKRCPPLNLPEIRVLIVGFSPFSHVCRCRKGNLC